MTHCNVVAILLILIGGFTQLTSMAQVNEPASNMKVIPFRMEGGLVIVRASVNNVEGDFVFDSGAPTLILNAEYFKGYGEEIAMGVTGISEEVANYHAEDIVIEGIRYQDITAKVTKMKHLEGIKNIRIYGCIGWKMFKDYAVLIDYDEHRLVFYQTDSLGNILATDADYDMNQPDASIPFRYDGHIPVVQAVVGSDSLEFGIDTGAEITTLDYKAPDSVLRYFEPISTLRVHGFGAGIHQAQAGRLRIMTIGTLEYPNMPVALMPFDHTRKAFRSKIQGLLGHSFLRYRRTILNFKRNEILVWNYF